MDTPIFEIRSLNHSYAGKTVLAIEHLKVQPASIIGLIGPNGSGKSSLLRLLGLIERPTQGEILFNGRRVEPFSDEARFRITLLPQEPFLLKRSVLNNVSYGLKLRGNGKEVLRGPMKRLLGSAFRLKIFPKDRGMRFPVVRPSVWHWRPDWH